MSSRGSVAINHHYTNTEYKAIDTLKHGEEIIEGVGKNHSMPDYSFKPNAVYVIKKKDVFHAMRIYNEQHEPIIEIAYHPEPNLNNKNRIDNIWHMHKYEPGLNRKQAEIITEDVKNKYRKYLEDIGYDQW
jgi:hypothetical protein